ncbi:hypothetical protein BSK59_14035 [Paenibacillus odorifer]|uniref:hypothetical protein n=1 Tax=Paenibacillus odorifer TaxID=189426 RepID=UPI00096F3DEF|nr:hypothetical protein [Paenibacillus odorifer]OME55588.1 hypothetical protein BSK59_14035 [Paenibacillus odorifer]
MNVVELWNNMNVGQTATSTEAGGTIFKTDYSLNWDDDTGEIVELNANVLCDETWEIDNDWVDFWTAFQAAKNDGWAILSEFRSTPIVLNSSDFYLQQNEIEGRWRVLD